MHDAAYAGLLRGRNARSVPSTAGRMSSSGFFSAAVGNGLAVARTSTPVIASSQPASVSRSSETNSRPASGKRS